MAQLKKKPLLNFWQIWNLSFGFLGIQIGYSLQSSQTSRILSALGADPQDLPLFWLAAPIAGLIVQPIIGMSSDNTWTRLGRRIPFIFGGAIVSAIAMFFMPNAEFVAAIMPPVIFGACMLLFMDCAFNVSMQPFRSLVGDMVNDEQRNLGYSTQSFLTNVGAVAGSFLPFLLTWIGIQNIPAEGEMVAPSVIWSFYIGGTALLLTVLWTSFRVKEYPPKEYNEYNNVSEEEKKKKSFIAILKSTPETMFQLAVVQFFSWFALFLMWVYGIGGIAENVWGTTDATSAAYNEAGNWNGVLSGIYGIFAVIFAIFMAKIADKVGRKKVYAFALLMGALGLASMLIFKDKYLLIISMIGVGIAWAAILAMPYAILSAALPASKMGVYMGIFNATITIPQIAAGITGGIIFTRVVDKSSILMLVVAGISMLLAAISVALVDDSKVKENSNKQRHVFVTFWLYLMLVMNTISVLWSSYSVWIFTKKENAEMFFHQGHDLVELYSYGMILFGILSLINVCAAVLLIRWKKMGFWIFCGVCTIVFILMITFITIGGVNNNVVQPLITSLLSTIILWAILQIKANGKSCWSLLK